LIFSFIRGGFAGTATAIGAARNEHSILVFDSKEYRNERATSIYELLTWDSISLFEYHKAAREEALSKY
jgi:2-polyprenyl-6-methoxyphenol hydroxylase-like FAD-dependent oxidoreductase